MSDDDDIPQLSREALAALTEFYQEQKQRDEELTKDAVPAISAFKEDWQLSQFWYDAATIDFLARAALQAAGPRGTIALISTPSLYRRVKELQPDASVAIYEFDDRFAKYDGFVHYDYNHPSAVPTEHRNYFDVVVADPPFLAEECLRKTSQTIKLVAKNKIVLCTGFVMQNLAAELMGLKPTTFRPAHEAGRLSNEFRCYSNFESLDLLKWE